ncbi:hypothetical protein HXX76_015662 [Chlamydomonas incerta]|uniref:OBG-type G domain-containing protein n=1 Tax=Chlamydomonas incerta TaxID=51695 RepID=A0A835SN63_CHLIN|nr:hypothetical protein HXX76_015662 [Chlamydomonas incerta]|eukprot:KAG2422991.1 hypothetical protein HXX76_015662 [Chlamydomonas incerta]
MRALSQHGWLAPREAPAPFSPDAAACRAASTAASCSPRCQQASAAPRRTGAAGTWGAARPSALAAAFCSGSGSTSSGRGAGLAPGSTAPSVVAPPYPEASAAAAASTAALSPAGVSGLGRRLRWGTARGRLSAVERAATAAGAAAAAAPQPLLPHAARPGRAATALQALPSEYEDADMMVGGEAADPEEAAAAAEAEERRRRFVGVLQGVPHVVGAAEQLGSARKRAAKVTASAGIRNEADKERNRSTRRLDTFMKELSVPLGRYLAGFPPPGRLHPFEAALLALTVGEATYLSTLDRVDRLRRAVQEVGKGAASRAGAAPNKATALAACEEGMAAIEEVFTAGSRHVDALKEVAKKLRQLPSLDAGLPTLALVGAPNVGKSSLVQVLSSGTPEVCNYPFTTRSIKMGHFYLDGQKHQVTDTPGLLARPDAERNRMERLTLAALGCLDSCVLWVGDLTEECGTGVGDQWAIRSELRARFPEKPWIDVLSKSDMLEDVLAEADELIRQRGAAAEQSTSAAAAAAAPAAPAAAGAEALTPAELAARLPGALRISSLTHDGIPQLQLGIIRMLRQQAAQRAAAATAARQAAAEAEAEAVAKRAAAAGVGGGGAGFVGGAPRPALTPQQQAQLEKLRQLQAGAAAPAAVGAAKVPTLTFFDS